MAGGNNHEHDFTFIVKPQSIRLGHSWSYVLEKTKMEHKGEIYHDLERIVTNQKGSRRAHSYGESPNKRAGRVSVLLQILLTPFSVFTPRN